MRWPLVHATRHPHDASQASTLMGWVVGHHWAWHRPSFSPLLCQMQKHRRGENRDFLPGESVSEHEGLAGGSRNGEENLCIDRG